MEKSEDLEETQTISPLDLDEENENKKKKPSKKTVIIASTIAAIVVLAGVGGYAYASNSAYGSYASRVESAKEADSKLVKKIAEAQSLVKVTKESDVLDKTTLASLSKSLKVGESRKGVPVSAHAVKWNLWSVSKANASVSNDMTEANDSINSIGKAMGKVEASKTAKQVKDAKDTLNKTISDAETLYKDSEGKVQDNKTRESLKTAIDTAKKTVDDKKAGVKTLNAQKDAVANAVKSVNDSKTAKEQAEAEEAARQAAQQQSQVQTQTYSNTNYSRANSGTSTYSAPTQQAQTHQSTPQQSQNQNNSSSNSGYIKFCATVDSQGNSTYYAPCN